MCGNVFDTVSEFNQHIKLHSNSANYVYQCGVPECQRTYLKFTALKAHMYRDHKTNGTLRSSQPLLGDTLIKCDFCAVSCETSSLVCHMRSHLQGGLRVQCPFQGCDRKFTLVSSFASHVSRKHKNNIVDHGDTSDVERCVASDSLNQCPPSDHSDEPEEPFAAAAAVDESIFLQNITLFYLKLQAKLLLPATTMQTNIEGYQDVHDISLTNLLNNLSERLTVLGIPQATIRSIMDEMKREDLFTACNKEPLSTDQKRKTAFKTHFNYIEPVSVLLGTNDKGKESFA